jgi:hypothetical protein
VTDATGLRSVDPRTLATTRRALHHAALLVSAVGRSLAPHQPGFRHAALFWERGEGRLAGWPVTTSGGEIRAVLDLANAAIALEPGAWFPLRGATADAALRWLRESLASDGIAVRRPGDMPPGPLADESTFDPDPAAAGALAAWFDLADERLAEVASAHDVPLPLPCWPDHFDLAAVVKIPPPAPPDAQVTLGFSPGDGTVDEPYWYVTAWPMPPGRVAEIPAPAGGRWQVEGWQGLVLTATTVAGAPDAGATVSTFLERGFEVGRDLLIVR